MEEHTDAGFVGNRWQAAAELFLSCLCLICGSSVLNKNLIYIFCAGKKDKFELQQKYICSFLFSYFLLPSEHFDGFALDPPGCY